MADNRTNKSQVQANKISFCTILNTLPIVLRENKQAYSYKTKKAKNAVSMK
jgi:hypothetical protein